MRRLAFTLAALISCSPPDFPSQPADPGPPAPVIEHVAQQEILTPLPLRVRLPASYGVEYVLVLVLTWGSPDWQIVELDRYGQTWTGEVSCRQVSTVTGDTRYFFLGLDDNGEVVASSGSPEWPHVATVVGSLPEGPHGLDGEAPPARCHDVADCPPDFPGCPAYAWLRPKCDAHEDCGGGFCSWDGYCDATPDAYTTNWDAYADEELLARAVKRAQRRFKTADRPRTSTVQ